MKFSILIPTRNGLEYLKLAYESIPKENTEIIVLDDLSEDGTWDWLVNESKQNPNLKIYRNERDEHYGISSGYKFLAPKATGDIICHWHNDMIMTPNTLETISDFISDWNVICLTRIEPPIWQKSKEKIIWDDAPIYPSGWDLNKFDAFLKTLPPRAISFGHFAPFFMKRTEYMKLGGNDVVNFRLQSREDSDKAFRLKLAGFSTLQLPQYVYHFASRGNRRAKDAFKDNPEWEKINFQSTRNFIRKWKTMYLHDEDLEPYAPKVYTIKIRMKYSTDYLFSLLEPWCDVLISDLDISRQHIYIQQEQPLTPIDLLQKTDSNADCSIEIDVDGRYFDASSFNVIQFLTLNIENVGEFTINGLKIKVNNLENIANKFIYENWDSWK